MRSVPAGFTLIEILVAIAIIALVSLVGYTSYRDFARRQTLENAYNQLRVELNLARQLALSGEKPQTCIARNVSLVGYSVSLGGSTISVSAVCESSSSLPPSRTFNLPAGITVSGGQFTFLVLGRGTDPSGNLTITLTQGSSGRTINATLSREGVLTRQ